MRLKWLKSVNPVIQILVISGLLFFFIPFYNSLSKYIKPSITFLLFSPLKLCEEISSNAKYFMSSQNLVKENRKLKSRINKLNSQLVQLQELTLENQRLRSLLSLPQRKSFQTQAALLIGKDSSNWTKTVLINKGALNGLKENMPVVFGESLVGKVIEAGPNVSKVTLITDFNSKVPALIQQTREEGIVYGTAEGGRNICKIKYLQEVKIGDRIISSGLGGIYPKGLLIGEVITVEEEKNKLYKVGQIQPAVDFSALEEVLVITSQEKSHLRQ